MASRTGPRAMGTDGTDFLHRERVAGHYKSSVTNKWRLKFAIFMHLALVLMMLFRLSTSFFVMFSIRPPTFLQHLKFPVAHLWEYAWLFSGMASVIGFMATRRNNPFLMQHCILGTITFGLLPVVYAVYALFDDMLSYWNTREAKLQFLGFPVVVLWTMFLAVAIQVHMFGLFFAWQLVKAWRVRIVKKKAM